MSRKTSRGGRGRGRGRQQQRRRNNSGGGGCCADPYADFENEWDVDLCTTCCEDPGWWCKGLLFPCCFSYCQRKEMLDGDMSRYRCCDNRMGCCSKMVPCVEGNEECCLCLEVTCFTALSVHVNRSMIQEKWRVRSSTCDKAIICAAYVFSIVDTVMQCCGEGDDDFSLFADCFFCCVMSQMLTQQEHEIELWRSKEGRGKSSRRGGRGRGERGGRGGRGRGGYDDYDDFDDYDDDYGRGGRGRGRGRGRGPPRRRGGRSYAAAPGDADAGDAAAAAASTDSASASASPSATASSTVSSGSEDYDDDDYTSS